jgi:ribosomal protein S18 acetylase RimI-like enzyme
MVLSADRVDAALSGLDVPAGLVPVTPDDVPRLFALAAEHERRLFGAVQHTADDIARDIVRQPSRYWLRETADGVDIWVGALDMAHNENVFGWVITGPDVDDATGEQLVRFAIAVARRLNPDQTVHLSADSGDATMLRWLEAAGGRLIRRFARMEVPLDATGEHAAPPEQPAGVSIRNVTDTEDDWRRLHRVIDTAFSDHFGHVEASFEDFVADERQWIDDYSLCWLATVGGEPAAALLGKRRPGSGYVGVLGTLREHRGRGLGTLLLRVAFAEFARRGETVGSLNVDLTNPTGAVRVYESVGMRVVQTELAFEYPAGRDVAETALQPTG